jgi:lipopolysaccharide export system protein LptA
MPTPTADQRLQIDFAERLTARFANEVTARVDNVTGQTLAERYEYLQSAEFQGDVKVTQAEDEVTADEITVEFGRPDRAAKRVGEMERVSAVGDVRLGHGDDKIRCRAMNVLMDRDERGGISPRHARAEGEVVAERGARRITATEGMLVDLRLYEREAPPLPPGARRGPGNETPAERPTVFEPGLRRLQAFGDVSVRDPQQNLVLNADELDCSFVPAPGTGDQVIDRARLASSDSGFPASVELDDFAMQGRIINLDAGSQDAQVPGAGRLRFSSRTDLDGRDVDRPVPIAVTWTDGMTFRGGANLAVFRGQVHAASEESTLDCERLTLEFADVVKPPDPEPQKDWWIFTPLFERAGRDRDGLRLSGPKTRKRLRTLRADGSAVTRMSNLDPRTGTVVSRARLAGDHIDLDMDRKFARVDCPGSLLIEDYKVRRPRQTSADAASGDPRPRDRRDPFGRIGGEGSSQTYLKWAGAMRYDFQSRTATFDRDVMLRHVSGEYLMAFGDFKPREEDTETEDERSGRDANLSCQTLFVQFQRVADDGTTAGSGLGSLSGFALDKFQAEGNTYFVDGDISVTAHRISYSEVETLLMMFGTPAVPETNTPAVPVRLYQEGARLQTFTGMVVSWNRTTGLIEVLESGGFRR